MRLFSLYAPLRVRLRELHDLALPTILPPFDYIDQAGKDIIRFRDGGNAEQCILTIGCEYSNFLDYEINSCIGLPFPPFLRLTASLTTRGGLILIL